MVVLRVDAAGRRLLLGRRAKVLHARGSASKLLEEAGAITFEILGDELSGRRLGLLGLKHH
jgi:hypothetical protein